MESLRISGTSQESQLIPSNAGQLDKWPATLSEESPIPGRTSVIPTTLSIEELSSSMSGKNHNHLLLLLRSRVQRGGLTLGVVFSAIVFKRRPWPLIFGMGAGMGMGYSNCQHEFNEPFLVKADKILVKPKSQGNSEQPAAEAN
ncbi:MICOS complex subunit Mic10 [Portunus trituberculatus]|uniref:MICOS complex subunit MIC10 n=1 Tax=Portunus trituberculatus TaxID=210409 RepID=A0A5B7DWI7_PORTR|nr:MICOS complex subunit Mic10 [Portunus trituberculatus]